MVAPEESLKILIAAGDPASLVAAFGHSGNTLLLAPDAPGAVELLRHQRPDLLIADLPFAGSLELCRTIRADATNADLWFFLIATRIDQASLEAARAGGVSDIAIWPVSSMQLLCHLLAARQAIALQRELDRRTRDFNQLNADLAASNTRLQHIAITDDLTGLFNRRHAIVKLNEYWSIAERYQQPMACAILDLDHFKAVNDTYGHFVGDVVLRRVASVLVETVRSSDLVCRIGGEEFLIIFPAQNADQIVSCADRCRTTVADQRIVCGDDELSVTISIGISEKIASTTGPDEMLKHADAALYQAKRTGRNRIVVDSGQPQPLAIAG